MRKFRHLYLGKDCYLLDRMFPEDFIPDCKKFCKISYANKNLPNYLHQFDIEDIDILTVVLQDVLDTPLMRSLLLEEYTERKKE